MYEPTALYFYKALFMAELIIAEALICFKLKRRKLFALRCVAAIVACLGVSFAIPVVAYNAIYCSIVFLLMFGFTLLALKFCFAESWMSVVFRGIAAYTMQHIAFQVFDIATLVVGLLPDSNISAGGAYGSDDAANAVPNIIGAGHAVTSSSSGVVFGKIGMLIQYCAYFFIYIATYYICTLFVLGRLKDSDKFEMKNSALFVFVVLFVLFNVVVSSLVTYYAEPHFDAFYVALLSLYNVACSLFTGYLMFEVVYRKQLKQNYTTANKLLRQAEEQYALAKQNVELINLKCHDLKHQIRTLGTSVAVDGQAIAEMEKVIAIYDSNIRTGNEALDIILTEKSLYCNKHAIKLYCIVDGKLLDFISDPDLYALFGNILDNAIEAAEKLDSGRRFINLSVRSVNGFPTVLSSNCIDVMPVFEGGLPKTTKADKDLHGFGMKSIKLICRKYDAEPIVSVKNGMFELSVVFMGRNAPADKATARAVSKV